MPCVYVCVWPVLICFVNRRGNSLLKSYNAFFRWPFEIKSGFLVSFCIASKCDASIAHFYWLLHIIRIYYAIPCAIQSSNLDFNRNNNELNQLIFRNGLFTYTLNLYCSRCKQMSSQWFDLCRLSFSYRRFSIDNSANSWWIKISRLESWLNLVYRLDVNVSTTFFKIHFFFLSLSPFGGCCVCSCEAVL